MTVRIRFPVNVFSIYDNNIVVDHYDFTDGITAIIKSFAVYDYLEAILTAKENGYVLKSDILCAADYGAPQKRMRFVVMGAKQGTTSAIDFPAGGFAEKEYRTVRDAIGDLEDVVAVHTLQEDKNGIRDQSHVQNVDSDTTFK